MLKGISLFSARINRISKSSQKAIAKFMTTEQRLENQNKELDVVVTELNDEMIRLNELRESALIRREENSGIIRRIGQIIRG